MPQTDWRRRFSEILQATPESFGRAQREYGLKIVKAGILVSAEAPLPSGLGVERHAAARTFAGPTPPKG